MFPTYDATYMPEDGVIFFECLCQRILHSSHLHSEQSLQKINPLCCP